MHWSEEIAERIIRRNPDKPEYVCAAGISPSGSIHIGNFRDIATSYFVVKALRKKGKRPGCCSAGTSSTGSGRSPSTWPRPTATWKNTSAIPTWT